MANCADRCITEFGAQFNHTNDTDAWESALNAINLNGGGKLTLPAGTSITSRILYVQSNTTIEGKGPTATRIENSTSDVFSVGFPRLPQVGFINFRGMTIESQCPNGGHIFSMLGQTVAVGCSWSNLHLRQHNPAKQIFSRVSDSDGGGFYDCLWEHLHMTHGDVTKKGREPMVPAFEVSAPDLQFQANTLSNLRCENSWAAPFFKFVCDRAQARNNNCVMSDIDFRQCYGGMVHWYSAANWICKGLVQYELQGPPNPIPTRGDGLFLGSGNGEAESRHMTFIGCDRRSGGLGSGLVDMRLADATYIVLVNCGENAPNIAGGYKVNANDFPIMWIGIGPTHEKELLGKQQAVRIGDGAVRAPVIVPFPSSTSGLVGGLGGKHQNRLAIKF